MIGELLHILEKFRMMLHHMGRDEAVRLIRSEHGVHSGIIRLKDEEWTMVETTMKGHKRQKLDEEFIGMIKESHGLLYMPIDLVINEKETSLMGLYVQTTEHMILFLAFDEDKRKRIAEHREKRVEKSSSKQTESRNVDDATIEAQVEKEVEELNENE